MASSAYSNGCTIPFGYCQCGCGRKTGIARRTVSRLGRFKGRPVRFVHGHSERWAEEQKIQREQGMKRCSQCRKILPPDRFGSIFKRSRKDGTDRLCLRAHCDVCERKRKAMWSDDEYAAFRRTCKNASLRKLYGITIDVYEEMLACQKGKCSICRRRETRKGRTGKVKMLSVDHCHRTGKVRGLLCHKCNNAIGCLQESITIFERVIAYLKLHEEQEVRHR